MSGRIKLLKNGVPISEADDPEFPYEYNVPGTFDKTCGSYGLDEFQLPHPQCPETYICGLDEAASYSSSPSTLQTYGTCTNAMNCKMFAGMTTGVKAATPTELFIHQVSRGLELLRDASGMTCERMSAESHSVLTCCSCTCR
jgi:hypothetical protein